jgi:hypothetical protein
VTVGGVVGAARGAAGGVGGVARGATVVAARGRNSGGTTGAGRGGTGGSKISGAGRRGVGVEVPTVVRWVSMVETVGPDSQRKSRSVRLGEEASGKLSSSKTTCRETIRRFVEKSRQR